MSCTRASLQDPGQGSLRTGSISCGMLLPMLLSWKSNCQSEGTLPATHPALAPAGRTWPAPVLQDNFHSYVRVSTAGSRMDSESSGAMFSCKTGASEAHLKKMLSSALQEDGFCGKSSNLPLLSPAYSKATVFTLGPWAGSVAPAQTQPPLLEVQDRLSLSHVTVRSPRPHSDV